MIEFIENELLDEDDHNSWHRQITSILKQQAEDYASMQYVLKPELISHLKPYIIEVIDELEDDIEHLMPEEASVLRCANDLINAINVQDQSAEPITWIFD